MSLIGSWPSFQTTPLTVPIDPFTKPFSTQRLSVSMTLGGPWSDQVKNSDQGEASFASDCIIFGTQRGTNHGKGWQQQRRQTVLCLYHYLSHCQKVEYRHRHAPTRLQSQEEPRQHRRVPTHLESHEALHLHRPTSFSHTDLLQRA
jgi:hypothetical protein